MIVAAHLVHLMPKCSAHQWVSHTRTRAHTHTGWSTCEAQIKWICWILHYLISVLRSISVTVDSSSLILGNSLIKFCGELLEYKADVLSYFWGRELRGKCLEPGWVPAGFIYSSSLLFCGSGSCHLENRCQGEWSVSINQPSWCRKVRSQLPDSCRRNDRGCRSRPADCRAPGTVRWCKLPRPRSPGQRQTPPSTRGHWRLEARPRRRWSPPRWSRPEPTGHGPKNVPTRHLKCVPLPCFRRCYSKALPAEG